MNIWQQLIDRPRPRTTAHQFTPGTMIGRWELRAYHQGTRQLKPHWHCRCECGEERLVLAQSLRTGNSGACGSCAQRLRAATLTASADEAQ